VVLALQCYVNTGSKAPTYSDAAVLIIIKSTSSLRQKYGENIY